MNRRGLCLLAGAVLLAGCAGLQTLGANRIERATTKGTELELAHWAYWDNACEGEPFTVTIVEAPAHGRTEIRDAVFAIPERTSGGDPTGCVDRIVESKQVFYIPNEGFAGQDSALVEFAGSSGVVRNAYAITVR